LAYYFDTLDFSKRWVKQRYPRLIAPQDSAKEICYRLETTPNQKLQNIQAMTAPEFLN